MERVASRDDTWEPITDLQGFAGMVKSFKDEDDFEGAMSLG